ncbi:LCP family protein [Paenibacillus sp. SI8]|uniref:LCP family protein n=1 Tax=unclassified Paenibacillus TaxID=185978 RepID=UPI003465349C
MKRWIIYTVGSIVGGIVLLGGYGYWSIDPKNHFEKINIPVLAVSAATPNEIPIVTSPSPSPPTSFSEQTHTESKDIKAFNVLVIGIDARADEVSRSDVIMVVHVIPEQKKANIVSLPRDTRVHINGVGYTKLTHAHFIGETQGGNRGGTEELVQVVSDFLDVQINYFVKTNFVGFKNFIDTIGGVDVLVDQDIHLRQNKKDLSAGEQHIDGDMALSLVRERWAFPEGDFGRQKEQSKILKSVAQELLAPNHILETASQIPTLRKDIVDTNFTDSDVLSLLRLFKGMSQDEFQYAQIAGKRGYAMDPLVKSNLYYWIPDDVQVKGLSEKLLK